MPSNHSASPAVPRPANESAAARPVRGAIVCRVLARHAQPRTDAEGDAMRGAARRAVRLGITLMVVLGASLPGATSAAPIAPQPDAPDVSGALSTGQLDLRTIVSGLVAPIGVTNAGDGTNRLFVVERRGTVRVVSRAAGCSPGTSSTSDELPGDSRSGGERGLLGLAFHPDFETNGKLFAYFTDGGRRPRHRRDDRQRGQDPRQRLHPRPDHRPDRAQRTATTTAASCSSGRTGISTSSPATAAAAATRARTARIRPRCSARSCASRRTWPAAYTIPATTRSSAGGRRRDLGIGLRNPWRVLASTARPATSGSPTSARTTGRRSTASRRRPRAATTTAGTTARARRRSRSPCPGLVPSGGTSPGADRRVLARRRLLGHGRLRLPRLE